jgi:hypothetical protein
MEKFIPEIKNKGACRNMWTVVYMAQSKEIAINLQNLLTNEGILVKLRPVSKDEEKNNDYFEILVPEAEIEEAHGVIIEKGF